MNETWSHDVANAIFTETHRTNATAPMKFEVISQELYAILSEIIAALTMIITFGGVIGNVVNIRTFMLMGMEDGVIVTFLTLSISDVVYTFTFFLKSGFSLLWSLEKKHDVMLMKVDPFALRFFSANIGLTVHAVTNFTTTYLAVVRCLCVAKPLHFKTMFTRFKSTAVLATFTALAIASHLPLLSKMGLTTKFEPILNTSRKALWLSGDRERVKDITRVVFRNYARFTSQAIIVVCIIVMVNKLRKSVQFRHKEAGGQTKDDAQKLSGKELNVVLQVVVICTISVFCSLFNISVIFLALLNPEVGMKKPKQFLYLFLSQMIQVFDCFNSSVNFFIYYKFNSKFRSICSAYRCCSR